MCGLPETSCLLGPRCNCPMPHVHGRNTDVPSTAHHAVMQRVYTHKHVLSTSISRGKSTGGLNWESAPWKHGILDANKLITACRGHAWRGRMRRRKLETEGFDSPDRVGVAEAARVGVAQPDRGQASKRQATNWHTFRRRMKGHPSVSHHTEYFQACWIHASWFMSWRDWLSLKYVDKISSKKRRRGNLKNFGNSI